MESVNFLKGVHVVSNRWWISFSVIVFKFLNILRHTCEVTVVPWGALVHNLGNTILRDLPREIQLGRGSTRTETWIFSLLTPILPLKPFLEPFLWAHVSLPLRPFICSQGPARTDPLQVFKTEEMWYRELHWWQESWEAARTARQRGHEQHWEARSAALSAGAEGKAVLPGPGSCSLAGTGPQRRWSHCQRPLGKEKGKEDGASSFSCPTFSPVPPLANST